MNAYPLADVEEATLAIEATRQADPQELYVHVAGQGDDAVLLLHGLGESYLYWKPLLPHLNQRKFRYIIPDLLGHGRSPKPRHEGYNVDAHIRYLVKDVFEGWQYIGNAPQKLVRSPVSIIGHGLGAILAIELAARFPERVHQVVALGLPYFSNPTLLWQHFSLARPLDFISLQNGYLCLATCLLAKYLHFVLCHVVASWTGKPVEQLQDRMKHASGHAIYRTFLYCMAYHDISRACSSLETVGKVPIKLLHPYGEDCRIPLSCPRKFYADFENISELAVYSEAHGDLVSFHSELIADDINSDLLYYITA